MFLYSDQLMVVDGSALKVIRSDLPSETLEIEYDFVGVCDGIKDRSLPGYHEQKT